MKPLSITIRGIGPFREEQTVNLAALDSPIAVVGSYGEGKTFFCEAIMFALFSRGGWYTGSVYDILTQGGDGEARIVLDFEHEGVEYSIARTIKTSSHSAWVYRGDEAIAGPKVGDVASWVTTHIGSYETAASTWFLSQSRALDLCGTPGDKDLVALRRQTFNSLLGIEGLDDAAEQMRGEKTVTAARIKDLEAQLAGEENAEEAVVAAEEFLARVKADLESAQIDVRNAEAVIEAHQTVSAGYEADLQQCRDELGEIKIARSKAETCKKQAQDAEERVGVLRARVEKQSQSLIALENLERLEAKAAELQPQRDTYIQWELQRDALRQHADRQEARGREIVALRMSVPTPEDVALAGQVEELQNEMAECRAAVKRNEERTRKEVALAAEITQLRATLQSLQNRIDAKPKTPFGDDCAPCPFMREYAALPAAIDHQKNKIEQNETEYMALDDPETVDLEGCHGRLSAAEDARRAVARGKAASIRLQELESTDEVPPAALGIRPPDPREDLEAVHGGIKVLSDARARVEQFRHTETELHMAEDVLYTATEALEECDIAGLCQKENDVKERGLTLKSLQEAMAGTIKNSNGHLTWCMDQRLKCAGERGRGEAERGAALKALEVQTGRKAMVQTLSARHGALEDLVACFGPRGVRQILIDSAAPELEDIADELFELATEGRMRLRISTQRLTKSGEVAEDFGIMVRDERGERDALEHSGGELQLISILFRVSVSLWIARLNGRKADCLCLDEAFDRLGEAGAQDLLRVLNSLRDRIGTIIVVTHDPLIADRLRSQIRVTRGVGGARVGVTCN